MTELRRVRVRPWPRRVRVRVRPWPRRVRVRVRLRVRPWALGKL